MTADSDRKVERPALLAVGACAAVLAWAFFKDDLDGPIAAIAALLLAGAVAVTLAGPRREVRVDGAVALTLASLIDWSYQFPRPTSGSSRASP